ncbi:MAG: TerB family tellurite resistance protein [Opitutales bacterium]|nr:TerB family tellurite resistance protein [Opitutales bacterium]
MIGKIIGGVIGAVCAGPWGAVIGATIGHYSVDKNNGDAAQSGAGGAAGGNPALFLVCEAAAKIAKAKGVVKREEIGEIEKIFRELGLSQASRQKAIGYFRNAKNSARPVEDIASDFARIFPSIESRRTFLQILLRIALSDGQMQAEEFEALKKVCRALGIDASVLSGFYSGGSSRSASGSGGGYSRPYEDLAQAYAILGVKPGASTDEIKTVYRKKCKDLHPDVLRSKGLGEFAMKAIEAELAKVNEAYDKIMKARR